MLVAVYLQTPDKRLLKIQYFFNFECRVPMFEDPDAPYSRDKIPVGWPDRGLQEFERFWEFTQRDFFRWLEMVLGGAQFQTVQEEVSLGREEVQVC